MRLPRNNKRERKKDTDMNWQTTKYKGIEISTNSNIQSYIVHFLDLSNPNPEDLTGIEVAKNVFNRYTEALNHSRNYHGRKFHTRTFGGGIGFPSEDYAKQAIDNFLGEEKTIKATQKS